MLKIERLCSGYNSTEILHNIDLNISKGEIVGILGPNGSGKTTFLKTITRVIKHYSGRIAFNGKDLKLFQPGELAKKIAVVSQNNEAEHMTVEEFVLLGRIPHYGSLQFFETKKDYETAERYMDISDVIKYRNQPLNKISGGERQLAHIAKALAQEPQLLLLDEPTAYLDIMHQVKIMDILRNLNRNMHITVLMVLHDLNLASEYCDRIVLIKDGRVYRNGAPDEVITYQNVESVYNTVVVVEKNPVSKKPNVLIVPEEKRCRRG
jgi:iron complex transport system ATP-binding protein